MRSIDHWQLASGDLDGLVRERGIDPEIASKEVLGIEPLSDDVRTKSVRHAERRRPGTV